MNRRIRCMLAKWLTSKNLTQADVVRVTGLSPNAVNRMYHNNFDRIDCKTALTLCDYLGCSFDLLFVLEQDGELRGAAFDQGRQLQPGIIAENIGSLMEDLMTVSFKQVEAYEAQCRVRMETEIERYTVNYHRQHEALLQNTSDACAALRSSMQGAMAAYIASLKGNQTDGEIANSLVNS